MTSAVLSWSFQVPIEYLSQRRLLARAAAAQLSRAQLEYEVRRQELQQQRRELIARAAVLRRNSEFASARLASADAAVHERDLRAVKLEGDVAEQLQRARLQWARLQWAMCSSRLRDWPSGSRAQRPGHRPVDARWAYLFNSYYEAIGARTPQAERGQPEHQLVPQPAGMGHGGVLLAARRSRPAVGAGVAARPWAGVRRSPARPVVRGALSRSDPRHTLE